MMSLERYRRSRLIVQRPDVSAHEAARAMEANHVGAILVQDRGELVGVVTDRDLALRVVGRGLDPKKTMVEQVMTTGELATLPISSTEENAVELMRIRHVRRIPLLEDDRLVGIVTLDDLVLESDVDASHLADVVLTQLEDPAPHKPAGVTHPEKQLDPWSEERKKARREETFGRLLHQVQALTGLLSREQAHAALEIVLSGIVRRISYQEAVDFIAQLPSKLQDDLLDLPRGPDRSVDLPFIERQVAGLLALGPDEASRVVRGVGAAVAQVVSAGEIDDVRSELPREMRQIFPSQAS